MDDLNKTLPVSNTPSPSMNGSVGSLPSSSPTPSVPPHAPSQSTTTTPVVHEADSLDKILADLEAQLKAKQGEVVVEAKKDAVKDVTKESVKVEPSNIASSPIIPTTSPLPGIQKTAEIVVEEKHDLMNVKSDVVPMSKTVSPANSLPPISTPPISEHSFVAGSGIAAALKKVVPETVGATNTIGLTPMKKDSAVPPTPPNMPGVPNMKVGEKKADEKDTTEKSPSKFKQFAKKAGKAKIVLGTLLLFLTVGGLIGVSLLVKQSQETRKYASSGWCEVKDGDVIAGYVPCDTPGETLQGTYEQVMNIRDNAPAVGQATIVDGVFTGGSNVTTEQLNAVQQQVGNANVVDGAITGGTHGGQENVSACSGDSCNTGNEGNGASVGGGNTTPAAGATTGVGAGTTGNGTTADNACTAQDFCGGANQGYCTCGADGKPDPKGKPMCQGGYEVLGGDCVPVGTKEKTGNTPAPEGTHCQSNGECASGLTCSGHVCSQPPKVEAQASVERYGVTDNICHAPGANCGTDMAKWRAGFAAARGDIKALAELRAMNPSVFNQITVDGGIVKLNQSTNIVNTKLLPLDWINKAKSGCNQPNNLTENGVTNGSSNTGGSDLYCHGSNGTDFCVPGGWSGSKSCDGYFRDYNIPVQYQDFGKNYDNFGAVVDACGTGSSKTVHTSNGDYGEITCTNGGDYSICVIHGNNTYTCYAKNQQAAKDMLKNAAFTLSSDGNCLTSTGGTIAAYSCPPDTTGGCQQTSVSFSGNTVCIGDIAKKVNGGCGATIQIDANDNNGNHYSINQWLPECGSNPPDTPPVKITQPPTTVTTCINCGGPEPTPSPAPPGSPVCIGISASIPAPRLGQAPTFTCSPAAEATRYEFRSRIGAGGTYATLAPSAANSNVSSPLTVNASGVYTIQCRPCNANGCANWESL